MLKNRWMHSSAIAVFAMLGLGSAVLPARADDAAAPDNPDIEIVVVTAARGTAADLAVSKSSLDAQQPESIITRTVIEDSVPDVSDYTGIAEMAPSVSGGVDNNGPGLSEKDAVIRGFGDGQYNVRYDGIPFGDTNDPTHHSTAYFPASTVGAMEIDRGPGHAGDLGQETLGGSMDMFSRTLTDDPYAQQKATYGSWDTRNFVTTLQSGKLDWLNGARATANFQELQSNGALSYEHVKEYNQFGKIEIPIDSNWTVTLLGTHNSGQGHAPDNDGITLAQAKAYGKDFTLSNNPNDPTYWGYNTIRKHTDFEYVRLTGDIMPGFTLDNTGYTYSYINHTLSATDTWRTENQILGGTYPSDAVGTYPDPAHPKGHAGAVKYPNDIAGYDKLNAYRVWGNITRLNRDFAFGSVTGTVMAGFWYEISETDRHRYDRDWTLGFVPNYIEKDPTTPAIVPPPDRSIQFFERSSWTQYQPFLDIEIHPLEGLTITPGVKYLHFERKVAAPIGSKTRDPQYDTALYTHTLPFLQANYKITDDLAVYAQYAQGFLVPPLKAFYVPDSTQNDLKPQTSANYQLGMVYNVDNLTFDADIYYVRAENAFQSHNIAIPGGGGTEKVYYNDGTVDYKGIEAEGTYAFSGGALDGLALFANGSINDAYGVTTGMSNYHKQIAQAPKWTAAFGLLYRKHDIRVSLVNKFTGEQWGDDGEPADYKIPAYNVTNLIVGYDFGMFKIQAGVYNLLDHRNITDISINNGPNLTDPNSNDAVYFLPERNYQITLRVTLD